MFCQLNDSTVLAVSQMPIVVIKSFIQKTSSFLNINFPETKGLQIPKKGLWVLSQNSINQNFGKHSINSEKNRSISSIKMKIDITFQII